jgi:hypothetical protein
VAASVNLEEPLGYPAQPVFMCLSIRLSIPKNNRPKIALIILANIGVIFKFVVFEHSACQEE